MPSTLASGAKLVIGLFTALFGLLGVIATGVIVWLLWEAGSTHGLVQIAQQFHATVQAAGAPATTSTIPHSTYASNLLTVTLVVLSVLGIVVAVLSLAGVFGFQSTVRHVRDELADQAAESMYHKTVQPLVQFTSQGERALAALDQSMNEWRLRELWEDARSRTVGLLRGYLNARVALEHLRLVERGLQDSSVPDIYLRRLREWVQENRPNAENTAAFLLTAMHEEGMLEDGAEARKHAFVPDNSAAIRHADEWTKDLQPAEWLNPKQKKAAELHYRDTRCYVEWRLLGRDGASVARKVRAIIREALHEHDNGGADLQSWAKSREEFFKELLEEHPAWRGCPN